MSGSKIRAEDVEALAKWLEIKLAPGDTATIASMLSGIRQSVYVKMSSLAEDLPPCVCFDPR